MATLKILTGLPMSGKTEYAAYLAMLGYKVFIFDKHKEKFNPKQEEQQIKDMFSALNNGEHCVFDDGNLKRKHRRYIAQRAKGIGANITCELFLAPVPILKQRCADPYYIDKELLTFECPWYAEGFDKINIHTYKGVCDLGYTKDALMDMPQDNDHHSFTVGEHEMKAYTYIEEHHIFEEYFPFLLEAAKYHDDGKYFTKDFHDSKGDLSDNAHYYGHENLGAYLFLLRGFCMKQFQQPDEYPLTEWGILYVANLINWHMRPMHAWRLSEKAKEKDKKTLDPEMYIDICKLSDADQYAH